MTNGFVNALARRNVPVVLQAESAECGAACLTMIARHHGNDVDIREMRNVLSCSSRGTSLVDLMSAASRLNLVARPLRLDLKAMPRLRVPSILHWDMDHFVVLERMRGDEALLVDPAIGRRWVSKDQLSRSFTGVALELTPSPTFEKRAGTPRLGIADLLKGIANIRPIFAKLLSLSAALQVCSLLMPFFSQIVIDKIVVNSDYQLLQVMVAAFAVVVVLNTLISGTRMLALMHFSAELQFSWAARMFHHLVRLPLSYFERRHLADVLSRFQSIESIQTLVTSTIVEAIIDGAMAVTTLVVMFTYGPKLAIIPIAALLIYCGIRATFYSGQSEATRASLVASAKEHSHFLETLRGMLTVKVFGAESLRESVWQNKCADSIRTRTRAGLYANLQQLSNQCLFGLENLAVVWVGAAATMAGEMTLGMLIAFLAFKSQFTTRATTLIDRVIDLRLASVHLERLSDIALSDKDETLASHAETIDSTPITGTIEAREVVYRHSPNDPPLLQGATFKVAAGECVAIQAPSGSGKTTFLKILMGLLKPEKGLILCDGWEISKSGSGRYRKQVSAVMQDDVLMSGSLQDNISFFETDPDQDLIKKCIKIACIEADVQRMPMGLRTLIGDMGGALSGGQRQRILLARALYRRPAILILDEATSHIDVDTEKRIHTNLSALKMTRIIVSHRPDALSIADRVVRWEEIQPITH